MELSEKRIKFINESFKGIGTSKNVSGSCQKEQPADCHFYRSPKVSMAYSSSAGHASVSNRPCKISAQKNATGMFKKTA